MTKYGAEKATEGLVQHSIGKMRGEVAVEIFVTFSRQIFFRSQFFN